MYFKTINKQLNMEDQIYKLKLLSIAYQTSLEYDFCPEFDKANEIKQCFSFAKNYSLLDIEAALNEHFGERSDEITIQITRLIDTIDYTKNIEKKLYTSEQVKELLIDCCSEVFCEDGILNGKSPFELYRLIESKEI